MLLLVSMTQHCMISVGRNGYLTPLHAHCAMLHIIPHSPTTQRGRKLLHSVAKSPPGTQIACTHLMTPSRSLHNLLHRQTVGLTPQPPTLLLCKPRRGLSGLGWKESSNKADHTGHSHKESIDRWHIVTIPACMAACHCRQIPHTHMIPCTRPFVHTCTHPRMHKCSPMHTCTYMNSCSHSHMCPTQHSTAQHTYTQHTRTHTHTQHTYPNAYYTLVTVRKMVALPPHVGKPT